MHNSIQVTSSDMAPNLQKLRKNNESLLTSWRSISIKTLLLLNYKYPKSEYLVSGIMLIKYWFPTVVLCL
jgi:hypothetical protein